MKTKYVEMSHTYYFIFFSITAYLVRKFCLIIIIIDDFLKETKTNNVSVA